jgi:LEA14-like dessication related protein
MRMNGKFLILFFICSLCFSCASLKPIEFRSVENFSISTVKSTPELGFDMKFYNPNRVGAKLKDFNVAFGLNDIEIGNVHLTEVSHAGAKSEFSIPVSINTSITQLAQFLPSGIQLFTEGKTIPFSLNGTITVKKFIFHKTFPFNVNEAINTKQIKLGK